MTDETLHILGDDADHMAAEYVLGVLDAQTRTRAEARLRAEPAFRAQVEAWERRLAPLVDEIAPVAAPPGVWPAIAGRIDPSAKTLASNVVAFAPRPRLWDRVGVWRAAALASAAVAASLAVVVLQPRPPTPTPTEAAPLTASLADADGKVLFVATTDRNRRSLVVAPTGVVSGAGRYPELWIIRGTDKPKPLGMLTGGHALSIPVASPLTSDKAAPPVLAVSLEPAGGSRTGLPTGPVIAHGVLTPL